MASLNSLARFMACFVGLILSFYALHVEVTKLHNKSFKAMCDISETMSCSKVFTSRYGTGFGLIAPLLGNDSALNVPNSIYGIIFYVLSLFLGLVKHNKKIAYALLLMSFVSCLGCVYLAFILYFVLYDFCVVCVSTYVVNLFLLFLDYKNCQIVRKEKMS